MGGVSPLYFLIAGEPSGDALGAALMAGLRELCPDVRFTGVGGPLMQAEGMDSLFPMDELSVMGIAEILPKYRHLMRRIRQASAAVLEADPDALITIDSPDFCLRVARRVKAEKPIRTIHYVAPTVWAWRPGRALKMAEVIDDVLCLFPFEPPYMTEAGMTAHFVGHPVATATQASDADATAFRKAEGIAKDAPLILVLPGSRRSEVTRLSPIFGEALRPVLAAHPEARIVLPAASPVAGLVTELVRNWPGAPLVLDPRGAATDAAQARKLAAFRAADVALAASGTVSLELAAAETPMVIAYDMNWISRQMIKAALRIDTVTLVNLVSETRTVPEFLGANCKPAAIADALSGLLSDPDTRGSQQNAMAETMLRLGKGGDAPGLRAARAVLGQSK